VNVTESDPRDPLHRVSGPTTAWTRVNVSEIMPGVQTPLSWTFWESSSERYLRESYHDLGLNTSLDIPDPADIDRRVVGIFYGRAAVNVDTLRRWYHAMPGDSGVAVEEFFLSGLVAPAPAPKSRARYPLIMAKIANQMLRNPGQARRVLSDATEWWRVSTAAAAHDDADAARRRLVDARDRFVAVFRVSCVSSVLSGIAMQWLTSFATKAGRAELVIALAGGHDSLDVDVTNDLWDASRGKLDIDRFLDRWGFRTPMEGELSTASWREDPAPIVRLVDTYREMGDESDPRRGEAQRLAERVAARRELLESVPPLRRLRGRAVLSFADRYLPLRNLARVATVQMLDVARAAIRRIANDLVEQGVVDEPADVFFLTLTEVTGPPPADARQLVRYRRAKRAEYQLLDVPKAWVGNPTPQPLDATASGDEPISGLGVSPGVAEGTARVIVDPTADDDLSPGEILVCETTDVSWISYFIVAAGVVIDVGTVMSHGAIAARELGIPCVMNSRVGTRRIRSGDRIRIDGTAGTVELLPVTSG
jgi:pyruvate,water dikinase